MKHINIKELKRLQNLCCEKLSEAAISKNRNDIIMWYQAYRENESEILKYKEFEILKCKE